MGVASSPLGAMSFAYCKDCAQSGAEPYGMVVATVWACSGYENMAPWAKEIVDATLKVVGKTMEELNAAVTKLDADYMQHMEEEQLEVARCEESSETPAQITVVTPEPVQKGEEK